MSLVLLRNVPDYTYAPLKQRVFEMLDRLGGTSIQTGSTVILKPNLLALAAPEAAMITHPLVIKAAAEYVLEKGGVPQISDSPAMGTFEKVLAQSGIRDALEGLPVVYREFRESVAVETGEPFKKIEIAKEALEAPFMINLPKLKTHAQMLLTLGVKNTYGCVVGLRKPEWHFRTGENRELFARLLLQISRAVRPSVTIIDGVLAMEGQGPGKGGLPRQLGMMFGSSDPVSVDIAVCRLLGIDPKKLLTNSIAFEMGISDGRIEVDGDIPVVRDFRFPEIGSLVFGPRPMHGLMRRHLVQRPAVDDSLCRRCGECRDYCPAKAIELKDKRLSFDYEKCIRCYCCIEVCPYGALRSSEPLLGRTIKKVFRSRM